MRVENPLEAEAQSELKRAWAAASKHITGARCRLSKDRAGQVARITAQVGDIENVKHFADRQDLESFTDSDSFAHAQILRHSRRGEMIGCWKGRQSADNRALGILLPGVLRVEPVENPGQVAFPDRSIYLICADTGNAIPARAIAVVIVVAARKVRRPAARGLGNSRYLESPT